MDAKEILGKYWPWALGGVVGIYVVSKFMGSSSTTASTSDNQYAAQLAAQAAQSAQTTLGMAQIQASADAQTAASNLANSQLAASATVAYNTSLGGVASATGSSIAQMIQAQSALPALAINSAMSENQTALTTSAGVAVAGMNQVAPALSAISSSINTAIGAAVNSNTSFYNSLNNNTNALASVHIADNNLVNGYLNASGQSYSNFAASVPMLANAVGASSASQVVAVSGAASSAASNQHTGLWNAVGQVGSMALWTM